LFYEVQLLYTAFTEGSKLVSLLGSETDCRSKTLKKAVNPLTNQGNGAIVLSREGNNYYRLRSFVESRFASDKVVPIAVEECLD